MRSIKILIRGTVKQPTHISVGTKYLGINYDS